MADTFEIKMLFEIYPDIDFAEEFEAPQEVTYLQTEYESQATSRAFGHIFDSVHAQRPIQTIGKDKYQVKFELSRQIDINRLNIAYTTLTPTAGDSFVIYDVSVTSEKSVGLMYIYTIEFYKYNSNYINHLSSDNADDYHFEGEPQRLVNKLLYNVKNPAYVQNTTIVYVAGTPNKFTFEFDINDLTDNIVLNQYFYAHVNDSSFDNETHYYCQCTTKGATTLTFTFTGTTATTSDFDDVEIVIDHEADMTTTSNVIDKDIDINIYTFINPVLGNILTPIESSISEDGIKENQKVNSKDNAYLKCWLKPSELYKAEYLNYALFNDIKLTLSDGTTEYVPIQVVDIITKVEKDDLIDLYEFDITILYNNKMVNINR